MINWQLAPLGEGMNISGPGPIGSDCITMSTSQIHTNYWKPFARQQVPPKGLNLVKVFAPERCFTWGLDRKPDWCAR